MILWLPPSVVTEVQGNLFPENSLGLIEGAPAHVAGRVGERDGSS